MRLQKFLSRGGVASRRAAEELIREGHVSVDDRIVTEMGVSIDPATNVVKVDGRPVQTPETFSYYVLDKPRHVVCTMADPEGRATVRNLIPAEVGRVYPVGRLDYDAEGVLLLTNDGDLAHRLMHPRFGVERTYHAKVKGRIEDAALERLRTGVYLEDGRAQAEDVRFLRRTSENSWITLTLREGRQHEVKRMCLAAGHPVQKLRRDLVRRGRPRRARSGGAAPPDRRGTRPVAARGARGGRREARPVIRRLVLPLLAAALVVASFPPFDLGLLGLVALAPLLSRLRGARRPFLDGLRRRLGGVHGDRLVGLLRDGALRRHPAVRRRAADAADDRDHGGVLGAVRLGARPPAPGVPAGCPTSSSSPSSGPRPSTCGRRSPIWSSPGRSSA